MNWKSIKIDILIKRNFHNYVVVYIQAYFDRNFRKIRVFLSLYDTVMLKVADYSGRAV
jgi:hypothetical protein